MTILQPVACLWPQAVGPPPLLAGQLHLWLAHLDAWGDVNWEDVLSAAELARTARYRYSVDRDRSRAGRGLLRTLLAEYLGTTPAAVAIETDRFGKPHLAVAAGAPPIGFNLSGSAHLAIFAFIRGAAVGVDIEAFATAPGSAGKPPPRDVRLIAERFAADEAALIQRLSGPDATAAFLRIWTCKEACLKCHGTGLQTPLDEIPITLLDGTRGLGRLAGDCFTTRSVAPVAGSIVAVAVAGEVMPEPQCWTLIRRSHSWPPALA
jgi:4'-phosphopantetheinyl transferase